MMEQKFGRSLKEKCPFLQMCVFFENKIKPKGKICILIYPLKRCNPVSKNLDTRSRPFLILILEISNLTIDKNPLFAHGVQKYKLKY
jgi:hypothetical protein